MGKGGVELALVAVRLCFRCPLALVRPSQMGQSALSYPLLLSGGPAQTVCDVDDPPVSGMG